MGPLNGRLRGGLPGKLREMILDKEGRLSPLAAFLFCVLGTFMMMFLYPHELLLFALTAVGTVAVLAFDKWRLAKRFLAGMLVGGACENIAVALGGWSYADANYLFTPLWLPIGWGISAALLDRTFAGGMPAKFSWKSLALALLGTLFAATLAQHSEIGTLLAFAGVIAVCYFFGYFGRDEIRPGIAAMCFGTAMEALNILAGGWHYKVAMFNTPLWLPLCWFISFLIMRRIIRMGEKGG